MAGWNDADSAEVIVVDGAACDGTRKIVSDSGLPIVHIQEADNGIYDAMNKGIAASSGEFVWFLNGGDEGLIRPDQLVPALGPRSGKVLLCDFELSSPARTVARRARGPRSLRHALPTSHQAIFYPRRQLLGNRYSDKYRVAADYALTAQLYANGVPFEVLHLNVARFHLDGYSSTRGVDIRREARFVQAEILGVGQFGRAISAGRHHLSAFYRRALRGLA